MAAGSCTWLGGRWTRSETTPPVGRSCWATCWSGTPTAVWLCWWRHGTWQYNTSVSFLRSSGHARRWLPCLVSCRVDWNVLMRWYTGESKNLSGTHGEAKQCKLLVAHCENWLDLEDLGFQHCIPPCVNYNSSCHLHIIVLSSTLGKYQMQVLTI